MAICGTSNHNELQNFALISSTGERVCIDVSEPAVVCQSPWLKAAICIGEEEGVVPVATASTLRCLVAYMQRHATLGGETKVVFPLSCTCRASPDKLGHDVGQVLAPSDVEFFDRHVGPAADGTWALEAQELLLELLVTAAFICHRHLRDVCVAYFGCCIMSATESDMMRWFGSQGLEWAKADASKEGHGTGSDGSYSIISREKRLCILKAMQKWAALMPVTPQPRASGRKPACVLRRNPAPPPAQEMFVVGSRVHRLLRDARAAVRAQDRPDTPPTVSPPPAASPLLPLLPTAPALSAPSAPSAPSASASAFGPSAPSAPSAFGPSVLSASASALSVSASASASPPPPPAVARGAARGSFDEAFVAAFGAAHGDPAAQLEQLEELKRWLSHPQRVLSGAAVACLLSAPTTDAHVTARAAGLLLRHGPPDAVSAAARRVGQMCQSGLEAQQLEHLLLREALLQPLLCLAGEEEILRTRPAALSEVLEALRRCSAASETVLTQLVSLGLIPVINTLVKRILASTAGDPLSKSNIALLDPILVTLMSPICLLYRNLSKQYAHQLRKLGSLDHIIDILDIFSSDANVVQAAARAMAKSTFEECCLEHYRSSTRAARAVVVALDAILDEGGLAVSRLCGTLTRIIEHSRELRDWIMLHHSRTIVRLVSTHAVHQPSKIDIETNLQKQETASALTVNRGDEQKDDMLKSIMWLVGVAAISAECSTTFVREITLPLVDFVQNLDPSIWRMSFIYSLMCLSNLSYFFAALEREEGGTETLHQIYATLGLVLAGILFSSDVEATVEATRVLGNMSLTNAGRDWMETNRCDEVCIVFLGHEDPRVVYNCFGVLLNLTAANACRVVADAELLQMLLQHTGRFTREEDIAVEKTRERMRSAGHASGRTNAPATAAAKSVMRTDTTTDVNYTEQIADLVEKLLMNLSGLV